MPVPLLRSDLGARNDCVRGIGDDALHLRAIILREDKIRMHQYSKQ